MTATSLDTTAVPSACGTRQTGVASRGDPTGEVFSVSGEAVSGEEVSVSAEAGSAEDWSS